MSAGIASPGAQPARLRRAAARAAKAIVVLLTLYIVALAAFGLAARPAPGDLAVVLGNAVTPAGQPSPRLQARLDTAAALYRAGIVRRILVSGGIEPSGQDEAATMAGYLAQQAVPADAILQDPHGDDTLATARNTAGLPGGPGRVVVVTQWFHVPRAVLAMRRAGVHGVSAAWPRFIEWRDAYSFLREAAALPAYALRPVPPPAPPTPSPPA